MLQLIRYCAFTGERKGEGVRQAGEVLRVEYAPDRLHPSDLELALDRETVGGLQGYDPYNHAGSYLGVSRYRGVY